MPSTLSKLVSDPIAEGNEFLHHRLTRAFGGGDLSDLVRDDLVFALRDVVGGRQSRAIEVVDRIFEELSTCSNLLDVERQIIRYFESEGLYEGAMEMFQNVDFQLFEAISGFFRFEPRDRARLLHIGCGDGKLTSIFAKQNEETGFQEVRGLDTANQFSPAVTGVSLQCFSGQHINKPIGGYNAILLTQVLHRDLNVGILISQVLETLRDDGVLVVVENLVDEVSHVEVDRSIAEEWLHMRLLRRWKDYPIPGHFKTGPMLDVIFRDYGFRIQNMRSVSNSTGMYVLHKD